MELQSDSQFEEIEVPVIYLRPEERIYWAAQQDELWAWGEFEVQADCVLRTGTGGYKCNYCHFTLHASQGQQPGTLPAHRVCSLRQPLLAPPLHASLVVLQDELSDEVSEGEVETEEGDNVGDIHDAETGEEERGIVQDTTEIARDGTSVWPSVWSYDEETSPRSRQHCRRGATGSVTTVMCSITSATSFSSVNSFCVAGQDAPKEYYRSYSYVKSGDGVKDLSR